MTELQSRRTLLTNGRIYRHAGDQDPASAMLVEGETIKWIGHASEAPTADKVIQLADAAILPGLTDAHLHILAVAQARLQISAADPSIRSLANFLQVLEHAADRASFGEWILGNDINEQFWTERSLPDRFALDAVIPDRPVALRRFCGHVVILNTAAMQALAGLLDLRAAGMDQDHRGLTGIAREAAADAVAQHLPRPKDDQLRASARELMADLARSGITAANEAAVGFSFGFTPEWNLWRQMREEGPLPVRLGFMLQTELEQASHLVGEPKADPWWQMRTLKLFADGIIGARSAALSGGFADGAPSGDLMRPAHEIEDFIIKGHAAGWQIGIHTIGDVAIDLVTDAYLRCAAQGGQPFLRHRIEHLGVPSNGVLAKLRQAGSVVVTQPSFVTRMGDSWEKALGYRKERAFPAASVVRAGVPLAGSSDAPTGSLCPWAGIAAFTTRLSASGAVVAPDERLTLAEAVYAYTQGGAFVMNQECWRGQLKPGFAADFGVYASDPFAADPSTLTGTQTSLTVAGGRATHDTDDIWSD